MCPAAGSGRARGANRFHDREKRQNLKVNTKNLFEIQKMRFAHPRPNG
jgi:hypothetical protein